MGDQKYLDKWPEIYNSCHIIQNLGAGVAPWNYSQYQITEKDNSIRINDKKLIFYHFHQFQLLQNNKFFRLGKIYTSLKKEPELIYKIYELELLKTLDEIKKFDVDFAYGIIQKSYFFKEKIKFLLPRKIQNLIRRIR